MLYSDRRGIWINGDDSKANCDQNIIWNLRLCEAISVAYAHFLINCIDHKEVPTEKQALLQSLNNYYKLFPNLTLCKSTPWSSLAKRTCAILSHLNPLILATVVRSNLMPITSIRNHSQVCEETFVIKWYKLHQCNTLDEAHFYLKKDKNAEGCIINILQSIGMNITDAPEMICKQFNPVLEEDMQLPIISAKSVVKYYIQFQNQIYNGNLLPCALSSTKFNNTDNLIKYLQYLMSSEDQFPKELLKINEFFSLGLIVTADEELHSLHDGKMIISSSYWELFPNNKQCFVFEDLQKIYPTFSQYLKQCTQNDFEYISPIIKNNFLLTLNGANPISYLEEHTDWVQNLLECITYDPNFSVYCSKILESFPLLPAENGMLYSAASNILPMSTINGDTMQFYDVKDVKKLLTKLKVPLLRHELLNDILPKLKVKIPSMLIPENILKTLYTVRVHALFNILSNDELILLFKILKLVSYSSINNQQYIKQIPIFTTINDNLVSLASASEVWIWNHKEVCTAGMDQWINCISSKILFLNPLGPWAQLKYEAENLQMNNINKFDVYCKFIFPNFHLLDSNARLSHLEFINAEIYPECEHILKTYKNNDIYERVSDFVNALKSLRCIPDNAGTLCTIGTFYNHKDHMFQVFVDKSFFLPTAFRTQKWFKFFCYFGLKMVPTAEEFIQYCNNLTNFGSISAIKSGSEALLNVLFNISDSKLDRYEEIHSQDYLHKISQIPIMIVEKLPHLDCIVEQKWVNLV